MTDYPNNIPAKLEIIKASEITPKEVCWLWYPYIPFGKVTLLQGDPGDGKSKLMLSLAALLSKGAPLPFADEDESCEPMTVINAMPAGGACKGSDCKRSNGFAGRRCCLIDFTHSYALWRFFKKYLKPT